MKEDIAKSGLDADDIDRIHVEVVDAQWCGEHVNNFRPGYKLPYFDATPPELTEFVSIGKNAAALPVTDAELRHLLRGSC